MVKIRVPATSANMGAGFDTLGIALNLYNRIEAEEIPSGLDIRVQNASDYIPLDERNLIYRAMSVVFNEVCYKPRGLRIVQNLALIHILRVRDGMWNLFRQMPVNSSGKWKSPMWTI